MDEDEQRFEELGTAKAEDANDYLADEPLDEDEEHDLDLELHHPEEEGEGTPIPKGEQAWIDRGSRAVARSAEGLTVVNTLELLPPFELSI